MPQHAFVVLALFIPAALLAGAGGTEAAGPESDRPRLTVLFDNVPQVEGLQTSAGFACLVQGLERTVLFDTGGDGEILLSNMQKLGIDPAVVDVVFLSHAHWDHINGLQRFLEENPDVEVWMPAHFPETVREQVRTAGARLRIVEGPARLFDGAHTTGEMGSQLIEQALVLETRAGLALVTGCAHPNIADIVEQTRRRHKRTVYLIAGGFHLRSTQEAELGTVMRSLEQDGVTRVAPSHCTGESAVTAFRRTWGDGFVESGCGAVIEF